MKVNTAYLTRTGVLAALGVAASWMLPALPVFGAKLFPAQAAINVVAGVLMGPWWAGLTALITALLRIALHTGTPFAIPGSIFGAFLAGTLYRFTRSKLAAMAGEVIGTGIIGAIASYPMALFLLQGSPAAAKAAAGGVTFMVVPFILPSLVGAIIGGLALPAILRVARPLDPKSQRQVA